MPLLAVGHKRTGACPTFERPVLQRDGYLLRVPLVGGALTPGQATAIAEIADALGNGTIELTNRGNLQVRGLRSEILDAALTSLRTQGLGDRAAALVTISPFATADDHALRGEVVAALDRTLADGSALSPKFVIHVDDAARSTAGRRAEATLRLVDGACRIHVAHLGQATTTVADAARTMTALAEACRMVADDARVADVIEAHGLAWLHAVLPATFDGQDPLVPSALAPAPGPHVAPDGSAFVLAEARFGRISSDALARLAAFPLGLRVTPWRSLAVAVPRDEHEQGALLDDLAQLGLIVDVVDPAAGVVVCIGAAGCWQSEADTLGEADRYVDAVLRGERPRADGTAHVSGCDKRCATRGPVAVTLLGRPDGSGFDEVRSA